MNEKLLLVGWPGIVHVGSHLHRAALDLGLNVNFLDCEKAFVGPIWLKRLNWWLAGRRPMRLLEFGAEVVAACEQFRPRWMLSTGIAPLDSRAIAAIGKLGVQRWNYLTDDPWNPAHHPPWFLKALPLYDRIFSPRRANLEDLRRLGCPSVSYLPFAYAPHLHYPPSPLTETERKQFDADVVFAGGADKDRVAYLRASIEAGFRVGLWGGYWERYPETRARARGHADLPTLRKAIAAAKIALCLVRKANRDGHAMRTFETSAMGACMLVEDTPEHREIFGGEGEAVVYFQTIPEMIAKTRWLLDRDGERQRLARNARLLITQGRNTYQNRLQTMLSSSAS